MRPTLILLSDAATKTVILERLRAAGEYRQEPVFDHLTADGASFGVDPTDAVLAEYAAVVLDRVLPGAWAHAVMLEYGVREEVRPLVLAITDGLDGVLDTNHGPYLRFADLPASGWLARSGHPGRDDTTGDPLAVFDEPSEEPGDPVIWPRWTGYGESDEATKRHRRAVLDELRRELVPRHPLFGRIAGSDAFHAASDDVLARLDDGMLVVVHPTWSGRPEPYENCPSSWSWARIPMPHGVCASTKDGRGDAGACHPRGGLSRQLACQGDDGGRGSMRVAAGEIEAAKLLLRLLTV